MLTNINTAAVPSSGHTLAFPGTISASDGSRLSVGGCGGSIATPSTQILHRAAQQEEGGRATGSGTDDGDDDEDHSSAPSAAGSIAMITAAMCLRALF